MAKIEKLIREKNWHKCQIKVTTKNKMSFLKLIRDKKGNNTNEEILTVIPKEKLIN